METIRAINQNGIILPLENIDSLKLKGNLIKIKLVKKDELTDIEKKIQIAKIFSELRNSKVFSEIKDVVKWQRDLREDRELLN